MYRRATGSSLIEMLISTVIMGILSFAFMSVLLINFKTNAKVDNMQDTINAVRIVKERIAKDVREGRSLGDVYGVDNQDPTTGIWYTTGSESFPSAKDPVWGGASIATPSGWPAPPWTLSNTCLIVQIPILDDHNDTTKTHFRSTTAAGWPTQIPSSGGTPPQDNVETHVYMIVKDTSNKGEYQLQFCSYGGAGSATTGFTGYSPTAHTFGPETLISGIIGPLDSNGNPKVFQFIDPKVSSAPVDSINGTNLPEYTGVVANLEIRRHQDMSTTRKDISITPVGMKLEVFLRNNALATSIGQPPADW